MLGYVSDKELLQIIRKVNSTIKDREYYKYDKMENGMYRLREDYREKDKVETLKRDTLISKLKGTLDYELYSKEVIESIIRVELLGGRSEEQILNDIHFEGGILDLVGFDTKTIVKVFDEIHVSGAIYGILYVLSESKISKEILFK